MIKFAELNSERAAMLFADYCATQSLPVQVVAQQPDLAELYIDSNDEQQLQQAVSELQQFLQQPGHPRYQSAAWQRSKLSATTGEGLKLNWQRALLRSPLTTLMLLSCLAVYIWLQIDWRSAVAALQLNGSAQIWRWFTPALLHFSLTHLIFNLAWWFLLGSQFEQRLGHGRLLVFMVTVAVFSNAAQYMLVSANFGGLSGVVYGLFGYFWLAGKINPTQQLTISSGLAGFMLLWLVLGFLDVLWISMANWAHLGGLLAGMLWAWLLKAEPGRGVTDIST